MTNNRHDFDEMRRDADVRRVGAAMYREATRISKDAVEDVAAVLTAVASNTQSATANGIVEEFAREMVADASQNAYLRAATE